MTLANGDTRSVDRSRPADPLGTEFDDALRAAQANAPWGYERLVVAYERRVAGYLRTQGAEDPDDLTSEVFLRAFRGLGRFEGTEGRFRSWLFTIAHNVLVNDRRRLSRRPVTAEWDERAAAPGGDVEDQALARLGVDRVEELLAKLSDDQRDVLTLRVVGDLTIEQVAHAVGKRPGAVKALQRRGIASLRRILAEEGVTP